MQRLFFISCFVLVAFAGFSQTPTFTFECFCGTLTPADTTCDICNTSTQSRYFKGLLIRKNGTAFKWIEEPYTVIQNFNALTFRELIPNAEQIRIELSGTQWTTIAGFRDSVQCPCAGGGSVTLVPGPGISIYGDTIAVIPQQIDTFVRVLDTIKLSITRDSVPFHFVILPPDSDNQNLSYAQSTGIMSISGGVGDTINVMVGASAGTDGERGLVPKPLAGEQGAFLRGDGTWANPSVGGDNWGSQVAQVTSRLSGDGTAGLPLDIAQQGATSGQTLKWNGSSWSPANDLDTSGYNLDFRISGDTLYVTDGASTKFVNLLPYKDNTDAQTLSIDSVTITAGRRFALSISNGNTIYFEDRDNQQIDTFSISGQVVSLSVQRDGQPAKTITLPTADGSETIVTGANGVQVTGSGTSGNPYVVAPPTGSDTQTLRYSGTTLTANSALTNNGAQIGINNAPDASYRLKVKQSTDTDGIAVVRSSSTSQIGMYHNANGILKTNANNMFFESAGVIALYPAGGGFISQVSINSQSPINVASGNSGLLRLDATYAPTAAGGDYGFLKIYPDVNQTSAADQALYGVDINPNLISLKGQLYGVRYWPSVGRYLFQPNGDTVSSHFRGRLGIGSGTTDPVRRLHVVGDMRLTGSIDTPTAVMGRDGDGDVANLALSGLSISAGTLTATDPSATNEAWTIDADDADTELITTQTVKFQGGGITVTDYIPGTDILTITSTEADGSTTNEIQRLDTFEIVSNTLRASLLNDAVPFSSVNLSPYLDNTDDQVVDTFDIVANILRLSLESDGQPFKSVDLSPYVNVGTDLSYSGASSPVNLNSSTGNDVTVTAGAGISLAATSGNLTVTNSDPDQSTTNELQTLANTSNSTTHTATLSNSGGSLQVAEGAGIGLATTGTTLDGVVTITATDPSLTNEIQTLSAAGAGPTSYDIELSLAGGAVTLTEGTGINLTRSSNTITVASTIVDTDAQNLTIEGSGPTYDIAISGGTDVTIAGAGILTLSESPANTLIFTATEADGNAANEGLLGVGAGGANTATLTSNTTGQTPVTVSGATGIGVSESTASNGGTITVSPANDLAALEALASTGIAVRISSETWEQRTITAGTGISVADGNGVAGNPTITNTGDLSATNELQTLNNTGDATSHTATLSNSGGSLKLKEGTNITLTTDVTGLTGEVTISATPTSDGNGIYGDGTTPGSGSDALPPGGSTVTIPGQYQPLAFAIDNAAGQVHTALSVSTDYCSDDAITKYLVGKSPSDSLEIYNFDCGAVIKETGGIIEMTTDREMYLSADSVNIATVPARTIGAAMLAQDGSGFVRKISGSVTGQILQWNGTNWALASAPTGTLDGAENGLTVSSNKVRLGGTLLTTTSINNAGFDLRTYGGKSSHQQYTGFGYTPTQSFGVSGYEGTPTTGGTPVQDGIAEFVATSSGGSDQPNSLTIGAMTTDNNGVWMQARSRAVPNFYYPLLFQPNGGRTAIGRSATTAAHFTVTASGLTGSTATGMVGLFENSGGSGNVSVGFGAGSDAVSGQLMWNGTTDAMRIINRNATNGTSSVRVAVGGETSDVATFEKSAATSLVQFGVGTTTPHSTVQSAGSIATAYLETVGAPTFDETKRTVVYTANTNITWTIPTAASCACQGREYILHHSGTAGTVTLSQSVSKGNGGNFTTLAAGEWAYVIYGSSSIRGYKLASL